MVRETDLLGVVEAIYTAALDGGRWPAALTAVADLIGGVETTLEVHREVGAEPLVFFAGDRLPDLGIEDYLNHYAKICPRIPYLATLSAGSVDGDYAFISEREMDRDAFYADFLGSEDLRYFAAGVLMNRPGMLGGVYVHRSPRQGHPEDSELALLSRLLPHLERSLDLALRLTNERGTETPFRDLLDLLPQAIVTLDQRGEVLFVNEAAAAILRKADGLALHKRQLHVADRTAKAQLSALLGNLLRNDLESGLSSGGQVVLRRPSGKPAFVMAVHRLAGLAAVFDDTAWPAVALFIYDPEVGTEPQASALAEAFSLTRREAGLAAALVQGQSLHEHAKARGVKISTVRTQLLSLMRKTDTHSQTELVRLLTGYIAALPDRPV